MNLLPATPSAIIKMLDFYDIPIKGKEVAMVGCGDLVGKPLSKMLLEKEAATLTVCTKFTKNIGDRIREADLVITATGCPNFIKGDMIKKDAVVIDAGIFRSPAGIKGDVDFESVSKKARAITPVPRGVGLVTIASLNENLVKAFKL